MEMNEESLAAFTKSHWMERESRLADMRDLLSMHRAAAHSLQILTGHDQPDLAASWQKMADLYSEMARIHNTLLRAELVTPTGPMAAEEYEKLRMPSISERLRALSAHRSGIDDARNVLRRAENKTGAKLHHLRQNLVTMVLTYRTILNLHRRGTRYEKEHGIVDQSQPSKRKENIQ